MLLTVILDKISLNNWLLELIESSFIFTLLELSLIVSYILNYEEYKFVKPLTDHYVLPQHLIDLLNSKAVLNRLSKEG